MLVSQQHRCDPVVTQIERVPSKQKNSEAWRVCTRDVSLQETPNPLPSDGLQQKCYPVSDGLPKPKKLYRTLT